jgi:DNA-binding HxlR family transcriptional regulator
MNDDQIGTGRRGVGCPLDPILSFLALKWLVHIVWFLGQEESLRFAELRRVLPGRVSAKVLSARLKQLERLKLVGREGKVAKPLVVVYRLTKDGHTINALLIGLERLTRQLPLPEVLSPPAKTTEWETRVASAAVRAGHDEEQQTADNGQMLEAGGEFPFGRLAVQQPKAVSSDGGRQSKEGQNRGTPRRADAGKHGKATDKLGRDRRRGK